MRPVKGGSRTGRGHHPPLRPAGLRSTKKEGGTMKGLLARIGRRRLALSAIVCAAVAVTASVGLASAGDEHSVSSATQSATGRFHNVEAASYSLLRDAAGIACIDNQPVGGMGVHYANG